MASKKTPLFVFRQPLISDNPPSFSSRPEPTKRRTLTLLGLSVACFALLGTATVTATGTKPPAEAPIASPIQGVTVSPEEIQQRALERAHEEYNLAMENRRQELTRRITQRYKVSPVAARKIVDAAHDAGQRYSVDPLILLSISAIESSFNPKAQSSAGAIGLTQTLPRAHPEKLARIHAAGKSPWDVKTSLELGAEVFSEYRARFRGDKIKALQQYNGSLRDSSRRYSNKVMAAHTLLSQGLPALPPKPGSAAKTEDLASSTDCAKVGTERC